MEGFSDLDAVLQIFGVASSVLMLSVAVFALVLRGLASVPRWVAILFPIVVGGAIGILVAVVSTEGKGLSPAAIALAVLTGFLTHGAAATMVARIAYPRLSKLWQESPPASETKDGGS